MRFGEFIFYDSDHLSMDEKLSMFNDCMEVSYEWHADTLDCSVSYSRRWFDCTFEEILAHFTNRCKAVVIDRGVSSGSKDREHFEIGFCTFTSPVEYFLFIRVDSEKMPPVIEKYRLQPMP